MHDKPVVFISGKITGDPNYKAKFADAKHRLERKGRIVLSPAWMPAGLLDSDYMRMCLAMIDTADMVVFLSDWQESPGARLEKQYCDYTQKAYCEFNFALAEWEAVDK